MPSMKPKQKKGVVRLVKKTTLSLDADLHKRLRIFAIEEGTTMTALVEKAVSEYMNQRNRKGGR